jgi:hypothetical protein
MGGHAAQVLKLHETSGFDSRTCPSDSLDCGFAQQQQRQPTATDCNRNAGPLPQMAGIGVQQQQAMCQSG